VAMDNGFKLNTGITLMDVYQVQQQQGEEIIIPQLQAPAFSGTFTVSQTIDKINTTIDLTGRVTGPMNLPVVENDYRPDRSPWFALINLQIIKPINKNLELYGGVKNVLNFIPKDPLLRPFDPFDKHINEDNPNGYTFDTTYNYAPIQGARAQIGFIWKID